MISGTPGPVAFSEVVNVELYQTGSLYADCSSSGNGITFSNSSTSNSSQHTFTASTSIIPGDTCTISWAGGTGEIVDLSGNDLSHASAISADTGDALDYSIGAVGEGAEVVFDGGALSIE